MTSIVPYVNGIVTLTENVFNVLGYLPKDRFSAINEWSTTWRFRFGSVQIIAGAALSALGFLIEWMNRKPEPHKYLCLAQQMVSLGILYFNHGIFNLARSYAERKGFGAILCAYDFYGRKILPPLALPFDLQGQLFERIRRQLDRIHFITLFPPEISLRA
jgi:hypothetical protein